MKEFHYIIKDPMGLHARPIAELVKIASGSGSEISVEVSGKTASARRLMDLLLLGAKYGDKVRVGVAGPDEDLILEQLKHFFQSKL